MTRKGDIWLGTQGFSFKDWVGPFYPEGTTQRTYLEEYASRFPIVEIDSTFYGTPRATTVEGWRRRTPPGFLFSAKFPKLITHEKKLDRALGDAEAFIGVMSALGDKLAVLTLQFAYDFTPEYSDRLETFLSALPRGIRYAVEIRNREWIKPEFGEMLSEHGVSLVLQDLHYMPKLDWITANFVVIRWLGRRKDVEVFDRIQIDRSEGLEKWAEQVRQFRENGIDVFGFFNNHYAGHSPESVRQFASLLSIELPEAVQDGSLGGQMSMDLDENG